MRTEVLVRGYGLQDSKGGRRRAIGKSESAMRPDQPTGAINARLYRMTIEGIPLRPCGESSSFELQAEPDWRERVGLLCWPRFESEEGIFLRRSGR